MWPLDKSRSGMRQKKERKEEEMYILLDQLAFKVIIRNESLVI